jgi:hypothetical protein
MGEAVKKSKWIYRNPPVKTPDGVPEAYPIRLTGVFSPNHPNAATMGPFALKLAIWFRDEAKPLGHDDSLSVEWRQEEEHLDLEKFGQALIALGRALVKDGAKDA